MTNDHFKLILPNAEIEKLAMERNITTSELFIPNDYYGHASILKKYCDLTEDYCLPGIIPHAPTFDDYVWEKEISHELSNVFLYSPYEKEVYSKWTKKNLHVIGAPFLYAYKLIEQIVEKIKKGASGSIVFPGHSTHHINIEFDQTLFIEYLKNLPQEYKPINICLGWKDIQFKKHYDYFNAGFNCTTAGHLFDKEFVYRLIKIIVSHKFSITNKFSTSSFYSAFLGLPVILFEQEIGKLEAKKGQPSHLLNETIKKPFLDKTKEFYETFKLSNADRKLPQYKIARSILGYNYILKSSELRKYFECMEEKSQICMQKNNKKFLTQGNFDEVLHKIKNIITTYPRSCSGKLKIDGITLVFADLHSFYFQAMQIFKSHLYGFRTYKNNPVIIDCGAHIGLATIYFAKQYPYSQIYAYEADPNIAKMLNENIKSFNLNRVTVYSKAVWINEGKVNFSQSGDDSGFIRNEEPKEAMEVPCIRLKSILANQHVDLLKLDIEGAEYKVIDDCKEVLSNVKNIIIEVHKFRDQNGSLGDILKILEKNRFEYTFGDFHSAEWLKTSLTPPFSACRTNKYIITIFAWQPENRRGDAVETDKYLEKAIHELNSGENSMAIHFIQKAIKNDPEEKSLYYPLSVAYARKNKFFEAQRLLAQIPEDNHVYSKASLLREAIDDQISNLTYLASYPRSGNTWMRYLIADIMLQQMGYQTDTKLPFPAAALIPDMHLPDETDIELSLPVHLIKTHNEYTEQQKKSLYIFRNPADSLISYYYFHLRYPEKKAMVSDGVEAFCLKKIEEWCRHILSYIRAKEKMEKSIMFVSYENMHNGLFSILERVLSFINLPFEDDMVARAINNHTFKKHRAKEKVGKHFLNNFFRKGQCGYGEKELSEKILEMVYQKAMPLYRQANKVEKMQTKEFGE